MSRTVESAVLKRKRSQWTVHLMWMLTATLFMIATYVDRSLLFWFWVSVFSLHAVYIGFRLLRPEMQVTGGKICFVPYKKAIWSWTCLPIQDIAAVRESKREVGGIVRMISIPTFMFVTKSGEECEYCPLETKEARLSEIRGFLEGVQGLPSVAQKTGEEHI